MLVAALAWGPLQAQTVYRVVDEAGHVTFTDDAQSGGSEAFWVPRLAPGRHRLQAELLDAQKRVRHRTPELEVRVAPEG